MPSRSSMSAAWLRVLQSVREPMMMPTLVFMPILKTDSGTEPCVDQAGHYTEFGRCSHGDGSARKGRTRALDRRSERRCGLQDSWPKKHLPPQIGRASCRERGA